MPNAARSEEVKAEDNLGFLARPAVERKARAVFFGHKFKKSSRLVSLGLVSAPEVAEAILEGPEELS